MNVRLDRLLMTLAALGCLAGCAAAVEGTENEGETEEVQGSTQALTTTTFTDTYQSAYDIGGSCGVQSSLSGREPTDAGTYPVFIYLVGWLGNYQAADASLAVLSMSSKGYVAASLDYANDLLMGMEDKARCAFDTSLSTSALTKLCSRAKADCSKGIVVMGHSFGGGMAVRAKNHNSNVQAVVTMGTSGSGNNLAPGPNRALPQSRLLAFGGQDDTNNGPSGLNAMTGLSCNTSATECKVNTSASMPTAGWYHVQNSQTQDGSADHCYSLYGGCSGTYVDGVWLGSIPPGLTPMLNWLDTFVTH